ncbi:MAG TPA: response regulator [Polyangiaceae bacterium]|nr:response regulator [Polyangiaceae bacterium]
MDKEPKTQPGLARRRILLVDDDAELLDTTSALLEDDYDVLTASSGEQALGVLAKTSVSVVCADYKMTGMSGLELLHAVRERCPGTAGVLITGMRENLGRSVIGDEAVFAVIYKPYDALRLLETVRDAARTVSMASAAASFANRSGRLKRHGA